MLLVKTEQNSKTCSDEMFEWCVVDQIEIPFLNAGDQEG